MKYKFVILIPAYLGMSSGKTASQASHAAAGLSRKLSEREWKEYSKYPAKFVLAVDEPTELVDIIQRSGKLKLKTCIFVDSAPTTEDTENQITAIGFFGKTHEVEKLTNELDLY